MRVMCPRFSRLLGECQQLDRRRQRLADALPAVFLSVVRDCTAQLLDVNWDEYTHETIQSKWSLAETKDSPFFSIITFRRNREFLFFYSPKTSIFLQNQTNKLFFQRNRDRTVIENDADNQSACWAASQNKRWNSAAKWRVHAQNIRRLLQWRRIGE